MYTASLRSFFVLLLCFPYQAIAQQTSKYQKWLDEDVRYIITASERTEFVKLSTDKQRDQFVVAFWVRRDPTPGTPENEFKEEHYRRLGFADQHFGAGMPGWKTDRGHVYIVYGPPDEIDKHVAEKSTGTVNSNSFASPTAAYEIWHYRHIKGTDRGGNVKFIDTCACGDFRRDPSSKDLDPDLLDLQPCDR